MRAASLAALTLLVGGALASQTSPHVPITRFIEAASLDRQISARALNEIRAGWRDAYTPLFIDLTRVMRPPRRLSAPDEALPSGGVTRRLATLTIARSGGASRVRASAVLDPTLDSASAVRTTSTKPDQAPLGPCLCL